MWAKTGAANCNPTLEERILIIKLKWYVMRKTALGTKGLILSRGKILILVNSNGDLDCRVEKYDPTNSLRIVLCAKSLKKRVYRFLISNLSLNGHFFKKTMD
jgi:hypothetical protein